jgi:hypothetical protein
VIIYSYNRHVRLLPPERLVVNQSILGSREPTLLCHHLGASTWDCAAIRKKRKNGRKTQGNSRSLKGAPGYPASWAGQLGLSPRIVVSYLIDRHEEGFRSVGKAVSLVLLGCYSACDCVRARAGFCG